MNSEEAKPTCLILDLHAAALAFARTAETTGIRIAARMPMMAITVSNSISVNPARGRRRCRIEKLSPPLLIIKIAATANKRSVGFLAAGEFCQEDQPARADTAVQNGLIFGGGGSFLLKWWFFAALALQDGSGSTEKTDFR